jgi:flagellar motility protein MotE (MotC chaperone)
MTTDIDTASGAAVEVPAPEVPEQEHVEALTPETPETEPVETEAEKEAKAIKALQRRIDKRTRDLYAERAQREQAERELAALRQTAKPAETPESVDVEALAERKARELVEQQTLQRKVSDTLAKGKALEGFDSACNTAIEELGLLNSKGQPTALLAVFLEADAPHEVLYHIGKNPEVADEFSGLTPTQAARRLAKLETELAAAKTPKPSAAPKPLTPVRATASTEELSDDLPMDEWVRRRESQLKARRGY